MPRESLKSKQERALIVEERMFEHYGAGACSLDYETPFQLVCAVVLSAQCTDAAVNKATVGLFEAFPTPEKMAQASIPEIEHYIRSLGFFRSKAHHLQTLAQQVLSDFSGEIPNDMDKLTTLAGVGRKTANVVMCEAFKNPQGIAVDTHVGRIAHRLKFAGPKDDTPSKTEKVLLKVYPQPMWLYINHQWVHFGREFCQARRPRCAECFLNDVCPSASKYLGA